MAIPSSHNHPHFPIQHKATTNPSKFYHTHFLCKSLLFLGFLIFLPLFPSQPPEFINQSLFTKFWELIHLLFVGIVVCYGLFSRKNVGLVTETRSHFDDSLSNVSRLFHLSPVFEDLFENSCGSNEKKMVRKSWNSDQYLDGGCESMVGVCKGSSVLDETRQCISEDGNKFQTGFNEKKVNQAWDSQYFPGESMVVAGNGSSVLDEWGNPRSSIIDKPLGLPIRSLRSRIGDSDSSISVNGSRSGSGSKVCSKSNGKVGKWKFGDLGPLNLENKFEECVSLPLPIPWRSRYRRMEVRKVEKTTQIPDSTPLSAKDSDFEPPKSPSFHSIRSFSSRPSSMSSSSPKKVPHSSSISSEHSNSELKELEKKRRSCGSSVVSPSLSSKLCLKDSLIPPKSRPLSVGSSSEMLVRRSFEDELKDFNGVRENQKSHGSLHVNLKLATPLKASMMGKSVRTVRAREPRNQIHDRIGQKSNNFNKVETVSMMKNGMLKYQKGEKQEHGDNSVMESDKDSKSEAGNFQVSSDEEESAAFNSFDDVGSGIYEVDKKAGEFIAKFREQIRLQKVESMNGSSGHWATYW